MGIYPFMFGSIVDFEPVAQAIIKVGPHLDATSQTFDRQFNSLTLTLQKGLKEPYDWDEYASMFFPKAEELSRIAEQAEAAGEKEKASEYYLSVSLVS